MDVDYYGMYTVIQINQLLSKHASFLLAPFVLLSYLKRKNNTLISMKKNTGLSWK
jgi:hypothetical protein